MKNKNNDSFIQRSIKESEIRYRRLFETAQDGILILDAASGMIEDVNPFLIKMLGYSREEFLKKKIWEVGAFIDIEASKLAFEELQKNEFIRYEDLPLRTKDGRLIEVEFISNVYLVGNEKVIQCDIREISEHKRLIRALQENEKKYHNYIETSSDGIFIFELSGKILNVNHAICVGLGYSREEFLSKNVWEIIPEEFLDQFKIRLTNILEGFLFDIEMEYAIRGKEGEIHFVEILSAPYYREEDIIGFQGVARDITARKRADAALRKSEAKFRVLVEHLPTVVYQHTSGDTSSMLYISPQIETLLGYSPKEWLADPKSFSKALHPDDREYVLKQMSDIDQKEDPIDIDYRMISRDGRKVWVHDHITSVKDPDGNHLFWQGIALDVTLQKQAEEKLQNQINHLTALRSIDRVIASNFDLKFSLSEILTHTIAELGVDAADILILDPKSQMLEFGAERGFRTPAVRTASVRLGESSAGRAALNRQLVQIPNLESKPDNYHLRKLMSSEKFVCYYGIPLITMGEVKGVLEVYNRTELEPDNEWFDFLDSLGRQAALAIENVTLFESLQRSNSELTLAYDATIEGWSHALDLRDKETEGHTRRVTELTLKLAQSFNLSESEMIQVRWGALLHDIGKMGVPDEILLKPGPLTDVEWAVMKKHPVFAFEMLSPIRYLRQSLEIPYCHHEKWDGSGYPQGLKGYQIPLTARIFAVADVWDALRSDRPYRPAWTEDKALEYINASVGTHFDPQVVKIFMDQLGLV
ncbi:MAG: PAS domain S-box protein [Anaerolineaceae bacterium]|nr:PAS domain S-box protein [Anaerolineaceae bacterium]